MHVQKNSSSTSQQQPAAASGSQRQLHVDACNPGGNLDSRIIIAANGCMQR
jgi:hypothetical protein